MIKKVGQRKKKASSSSNLFLKMQDKSDKIHLQLAFNMYVPRSSCAPLNVKHSETIKPRTPTATPKPKIIKKSLKQNGYFTATNSINHSGISSPIDCQPIQVREKGRIDYRFLHQIGSGGFGRVWKVQQKKTNQLYALKEISKAKVLLKKSVGSVVNEKIILQQLNNPFIINMRSAFQDREYLYMVMEYLRGADLRYHLCFFDEFNEEQTKFIAACIVLALEYSHSKGIIHRDLKPENLVFQQSGYLRITDFGVARIHKDNNSEETSGTPGYMAPQVICRMNHSFQADFFALGVIIYEIMQGTRPYQGQSRKQIRQKILSHQVKINEPDLPLGWSYQSMDFVNRLLKRNKQTRLGYKGIDELKKHEWFNGINWRKLARKEIIPPFIPGVVTETAQYQKQMQCTVETLPNDETQMLLRTIQIQKLFKDYDDKKIKKPR